jgi:hypothetical protein
MLKKIFFVMIMVLSCVNFFADTRDVNTMGEFQDALLDGEIDKIVLRANLLGNFECKRGNITIDGNGHSIIPNDKNNEILFFNGPMYNRNENVTIQNLTFEGSEDCGLYMENYNMIKLDHVEFSNCEKGLTLDGCFNTEIASCEFDQCAWSIYLINGTAHYGGAITLNNSVFENFNVAIYDFCVPSNEKDQGIVAINHCKFHESDEGWTYAVKKINSDNVFGNKKQMAYKYQYHFSDCYFDKRIYSFNSKQYEENDLPSLMLEISDLGGPIDDKINEMAELLNAELAHYYEDSELIVNGEISVYINNPTQGYLNEFLLNLFKLINLQKTNLCFANYFLEWNYQDQCGNDPIYDLYSSEEILDDFITPIVFVASNNGKNLLDFLKQAQNCYVEGEPLNELMNNIPVEKSEFFRKNITLYNDFYTRRTNALKALDVIIGKAKQIPDFYTKEEFNRIEKFRLLFIEYYNLYDKFLRAQLFDVPLNYLYLSFMNQIFYNMDNKDILGKTARQFTDFGVIKYNCSVLDVTSDNFDQILEMFKDYLGKKEYEAVQVKAKTTPQWFKNSTVKLLRELD